MAEPDARTAVASGPVSGPVSGAGTGSAPGPGATGPDDCQRCEALSQRVDRLTRRVERERRRREEAERLARQYAEAALRDPVSGLATRPHFIHRAAQALEHAERQGHQVGVLVADLNRFGDMARDLDDATLGACLSEVGERIEELVGPADTVARLGGDVFGVLLAKVTDGEELRAFAKRVTLAVAQPWRSSADTVAPRCSLGLRIATAGEHPEAVLREAEAALYVAKSGQGAGVVLFDSARAECSDRRRFEVSLREAMRTGSLEAWYQPVLDLASGDVVGAEALARWHHPEQGQISPAVFIDRAEETGLIGLVTDHVLELACTQAARWNSTREGTPLLVHVNVSGQDLCDPGLMGRVTRALSRAGAAADHLCLEITERALISDDAVAQANLAALREHGVRFAIDDFGVEYASFSYLRRFPVEILKIDRSFVEGLATDDRDRAVLNGMVAMARSLGMRTVAEGVETDEQLQVLHEAGVDEAQGWLFGRPRPAQCWRTS